MRTRIKLLVTPGMPGVDLEAMLTKRSLTDTPSPHPHMRPCMLRQTLQRPQWRQPSIKAPQQAEQQAQAGLTSRPVPQVMMRLGELQRVQR